MALTTILVYSIVHKKNSISRHTHNDKETHLHISIESETINDYQQACNSLKSDHLCSTFIRCA